MRSLRLGAGIWIAGGVGHFLLVDVGSLWLPGSVSKLEPDAEVLSAVRASTLEFGLLGETNLFLAFAGFSLWVALSLVFLGFVYLALSAQSGLDPKPFARLGFVISLVFGAVSFTCFIWPPTVAAIAAALVFLLPNPDPGAPRSDGAR